jgi:hypothetical protein
MFALGIFGIVEYWIVGMLGQNEFYLLKKSKSSSFITHYSIIPSFQYSILILIV